MNGMKNTEKGTKMGKINIESRGFKATYEVNDKFAELIALQVLKELKEQMELDKEPFLTGVTSKQSD